MQLRKTLILVQNQSSYRQIIVRFGQIESERLIDFFYLQAGGQHILAFINLLANIGSIIVLIFYISKYFFYQIFQRYNTGRTAKLIHHYGNRFLLLHKELHQFIGGHGFGHNRHLLHILMPVFRSTKHFRRMNITHHIVDISIVHNDLGNSGFDEAAFQLVQRSCQINSHHFGTRNDTVADFYVRKIQSILKDFHFRIQFLLILGIINTALHEVVQVDFSKRSVGCILVNLHSKDTKE